MVDSPARPWRVRVLMVGTTEGPNGLPQVAGDLAAVRAALTDPGTGITHRPHTRTLNAPTSASVLASLRVLRRRSRLDLLIFYFSGHGYLDPRDQSLRLGMADSKRWSDQPDTFGLSYDELAEELRRTRAGQIVVILDCCYSGRALYDVPRDPDFGVLTSVQANRQTPQDSAKPLSPYTEVLVEQLKLRTKGERTFGVDVAELHERLIAQFHDRLLPIGDTDRVPTEEEAERLPAAERRAHRWSPQYSYGASAVILSRPGGLPALPKPRFQPTAGAWGALSGAVTSGITCLREVFGTLTGHWKAAGGLAAVLSVMAGCLILWPDGQPADAFACPLPLQLRVLASTESKAAITAAADGFERSPLDHQRLGPRDHAPTDCRRITLSVYAAPANQIQAAFAAAADWSGGRRQTAASCPGSGAADQSCLVPLRDVGPQPDLWIPDSSAELTQVLAAHPALDGPALVSQGSVASSKLVLGLPASAAGALAAAGLDPQTASWQDILGHLPQSPAVRLLRPNPATSGTGLLQTVGLYLGYQGKLGHQVDLPAGEARRLEGSFAVPGRASGDSRQVLCELTGQADSTAVLVSEQAVRRLDSGMDSLGCPGGPAARPRLTRYYPAGLPGLDHPLVTVDWPGTGDHDQRTAAAGLFRQWLLDPAGGGEDLKDQGFDPPTSDGGTASPSASATGPAAVPEPDAGQIAATLAEYGRARQPGRVLFLLDLSASMGEGGKLSASLAGLGQALAVLGPQDRYGIWTFPAAASQGSGFDEQARLGSTDPAEGARKLPQLTQLPLGADLYEVVGRGLDALRDGAGEQPQLLVVLTDGDDRALADPGVQQALSQVSLSALTSPKIPVVVAALPGVDCGGALNTLATGSGGRCLPNPGDLGRQLAGLVAAVGSGGAR